MARRNTRDRAVPPCLPSRRFARALGVAGIILGLALGAPAHAHSVVKPESFDESLLKPDTPTTLTLTFNAGVHPQFSKVHLLDAAGKEQPLKSSPGPTPNTLIVELPALPAGAYALRYRVLSADGHYSDNKLRFRIRDRR
jgi:methionine-rich copper-binding protein CopC